MNHFVLVYDGRVRTNRANIEKALKAVFGEQRVEKASEELTMAFKEQTIRRGRSWHALSARNVETCFVVLPAIASSVRALAEMLGGKLKQLEEIKSSCAIVGQVVPFPADMVSVTAEEKQRYLSWCMPSGHTVNVETLAVGDAAASKRYIGQLMLGHLPVSWYDRSIVDVGKLLTMFNINELYDMTCSQATTGRAVLSMMSKDKSKSLPAMRWCGVAFTDEHVGFCQKVLEDDMLRFMGDPNRAFFEKKASILKR